MPTSDLSYNLMDRPWIPVTMTDGSFQCLSIVEVLERADRIRSIDGDIPLQRFALVRLLLAIIYGTFGHLCVSEQSDQDYDDVSHWKMLFGSGSERREDVLPALLNYCNYCRERFSLFDNAAPFYQVAGLHTAKDEVSGLERLILDVPNGEKFFTTRIGEGLATMSAAEAARWLVTLQAFDASGIKSGAVGDPRVKGGKGYPIGVAWAGHLGGDLVEGSNLWQTLILNYVGVGVLGLDDESVWNDNEDVPIWEREPLTAQAEVGLDQPAEKTGHTVSFLGPATLLTWQSRRVLLAHDGETVTGVLICNGDRLKPQNAHQYETMTSWRRSDAQEKALKMSLVYMPRKHDPSRALWRGLPTLIVDEHARAEHGSKPPKALRPLTLRWLDKVNIGELPIRLHAFGVEYGSNEAVVDTTVDDVLDLNLTVLSSQHPELGGVVCDAVGMVDNGVQELRNLAGNIAIAAGLPVDGPRTRAADTGYTAFDSAFRRWVRGIDSDADVEEVRQKWSTTVRRILFRLGNQLAAQASSRAIVGRDITRRNPKTGASTTTHYCVALAEIWYRGRINKLIPEVPNEGENE